MHQEGRWGLQAGSYLAMKAQATAVKLTFRREGFSTLVASMRSNKAVAARMFWDNRPCFMGLLPPRQMVDGAENLNKLESMDKNCINQFELVAFLACSIL